MAVCHVVSIHCLQTGQCPVSIGFCGFCLQAPLHRQHFAVNPDSARLVVFARNKYIYKRRQMAIQLLQQCIGCIKNNSGISSFSPYMILINILRNSCPIRRDFKKKQLRRFVIFVHHRLAAYYICRLLRNNERPVTLY